MRRTWDFRFSRRRVWTQPLMMEAVRTYETSVYFYTTTTRRNIPEDCRLRRSCLHCNTSEFHFEVPASIWGVSKKVTAISYETRSRFTIIITGRFADYPTTNVYKLLSNAEQHKKLSQNVALIVLSLILILIFFVRTLKLVHLCSWHIQGPHIFWNFIPFLLQLSRVSPSGLFRLFQCLS
jgi:hypothetical protein